MKKYYLPTGKCPKYVLKETINRLIDYYQINREVMEENEKIDHLENIIDLIKIKDNIGG